MIKEDSQLKSLPITDGSIFMLMGAAEGKGMDIEKIEKKTFVENMTDAEKAKYYKDNLGVHFFYTRLFFLSDLTILETLVTSTLQFRLCLESLN